MTDVELDARVTALEEDGKQKRIIYIFCKVNDTNDIINVAQINITIAHPY